MSVKAKPLPYGKLPLSNNFIFTQVMKNPKVCRLFLEALLQKPIAKIRYIDKEKDLADTLGAHGIRLDIYLEDEQATRYNIEMQCLNQKGLERRIRYYQGGIDRDFLAKGGEYKNLPDSYIIFICDFDYFGAGVAMYERESRVKGCDIPYEDGSHAIILNSKYSNPGDASKDILEFLDYIRTNDGNIPVFGQLTLLARKVSDAVRSDKRLEAAYMKFEELLNEREQKGVTEGRLTLSIQLYNDRLLSLKDAAERNALSEEEFLAQVRAYNNQAQE